MKPASGWRRWLPIAWVALLSVVVVGPALLPGFALSYDLVFTPRQDLLPASLGLGGSLPRAVPQDVVVALAETLIPGEGLEKLALLGIPLVAGLGMLRLLRGASTSARVIAATLAVWNPFVAERLVIGHWGFLLAYAVVPWALAVAVEVRRGKPGAWLRLVLLVAAGSLTPSGSILVTLIAVPVAVAPGSQTRARWRSLALGGALACWLPWVLPSVLHPALDAVDPAGVQVFALRDEGFGVILTALGLGGIWNADVAPASRTWPTSAVLAVLLLALAMVGVPAMRRLLGRALVAWWVVCALVGLGAALASTLVPGLWESLLGALPGGGILRDAHKLLAPLALLVAAGAGLAIGQIISRIRDASVRGPLLVLVVIVPIAILPDLAWGAGGRVAAVSYPPAWQEVRDALAVDERPGDVLVMPWAAFRQFEWNSNRTVLDPAPRWLPRTSVVADELAVDTPDGVVVVQGEDPRGQRVGRALAADEPLAPLLPGMGIGWVLVELGQRPGLPPSALAGLTPVRAGPDLALYSVPGEIVPVAAPPYAPWVIAVDLLVAAMLLLAALLVVGGVARARRRGERRAASDPLVR